MTIEGLYKSTPEKNFTISKEELVSVIEDCLFNKLQLTDAVENANLPNASGTIEANLFFNLLNSNNQIIFNGVSLTADKYNFNKLAREKIEQKIDSLGEGDYTINTLLFEYKIPTKNHHGITDKYLVVSRRNMPIT